MSKFGHLSKEAGLQKITDHFRVGEIWCSCCHRLPETDLLYYHMDRMELLRVSVGFAVSVNSGYRCLAHNMEVGGASDSMHLRIATDVRGITSDGWVLDRIEEAAKDLKFGGIIRYRSFVHVDSREFLDRNQYWAEG